MRNRIIQLVDRHVHLIKLTEKMNKIFAPYHLYYFVVNKLVIALAIFNIAFSPFLSQMQIVNFLIIIGLLVQLFSLTFFGQVLVDSSENLAYGVNNCGWEEWENIENKKMAMIVLINAQKLARVAMWNFRGIAFEEFTKVNLKFKVD